MSENPFRSLNDVTPEEWHNAAAAAAARRVAQVGTDELSDAQVEALNRALSKPFGELPMTSRMYVFGLHQAGKLRIYRTNGFSCITQPTWHAETQYRVEAIREPKTKPSIDWSALSPRYRWLARDLDGGAWAFSAKPAAVSETCWHCPDQETELVRIDKAFASYQSGDVDWKDSLTERPEGV